MIIADALKTLFNDLSITIEGLQDPRKVNFHYGDQKELIKWALNMANDQKYPLLWYVLAPFTEHNDWLTVTTDLVILQNTRPEWFNTQRKEETYKKIIAPTWEAVKKKLISSPYIHVIGDKPTRFTVKDEPFYGLDTNAQESASNDFTRKATKGDQSAVIDYVDARIIRLTFKIKPNCI